MLPEPYRVLRRFRETVDTWTLELEPVAGEPASIAPGQFTMVYAFGVGEVPVSVSGDLTRAGPLAHTVRAVGAVSDAITSARRGSVLGIRGPLGNSWPVAEAVGRDVVVVAGGIGLAPLRPALYHLLAHRRDYGRLTLLYGGRSPAELLFTRELDRWRESGELAVELTVDAAIPGWTESVGVVPRLVERAELAPSSAVALVCGPEVMFRFAADALRARGLPADAIWVSLERNMRCGVGLCGHCQLGTTLICRDGPVYRWDEVEGLLGVREL